MMEDNLEDCMEIRIFTGCYKKCKAGNLISISGDRGKSVGFEGKALPCLAPKREFWGIWKNNVGKISEEENTRFYIESYYKEVLQKVDFEILFKTTIKEEQNPILLCYEESNEFCHRHILAAYLEIKYGLLVPEIEIDENGKIMFKLVPENIKRILEEICLGTEEK